MGGKSSRELSKKDYKLWKKEQLQGFRQREVLPPDFSPESYNDSYRRSVSGLPNNLSDYFNTPTDFCSSNPNEGVVKFNVNSENCFLQSLSSSNNGKFDDLNSKNCFLQRPSIGNDRYKESQIRRPIRRHNSFNEIRLEFRNGVKDFCSSRIRCNSLFDLSNGGFQFEGQYMGSRFTNLSSFNLSRQNHSFDRSSPYSSSTYDDQSPVGSVGIGEEMLAFHSPVDRRQSNESQSVDNRNRHDNWRRYSGLSLQSSNSLYSENAIPLPDEARGALDILSFPLEWSSCAVDRAGYVAISLSSPEGKSILKFFLRTSKSKELNLSISGIVRIENPYLHTLYLLKKEEMTLRNGYVDELFLYHGTKKRLLTNICENNLDWRQYSKMHRFGKGVSFSPSATYSSHYSDEMGSDKVLLLFKVLVSKSVLGSPEMNIPWDDGGDSYDTSVKEDVSVIVKYNDNEFYPLYKIFYKCKGR